MTLTFDIGKTHKKATLFDSLLVAQASHITEIGPVEERGVRAENVGAIEKWMLGQIAEFAALYPIDAISISTHGAAAVCVDDTGLPAVPVLDYTFEIADSEQDAFWNEVGDSAEWQRRTLTAEIRPLINVGKLLWYTRRTFPVDFARTKHILFYPQYFGFRLTGVATAEFTYAGCHTYLLDGDVWSDMADRLGIRSLLPQSLGLPTESLGTVRPDVARHTGLGPDVRVTRGVHDSNAALAPYLGHGDSDFVLNSTGTWCVAMHPTSRSELEHDEIGKLVYFNRSVLGGPVKTAILMGGLEFETWVGVLQRAHDRSDIPSYDHDVYNDVTRTAASFVLPSVIPGTGQFPQSRAEVVDEGTRISLDEIRSGHPLPGVFASYEHGVATVNLSLAIQSSIAIRRAGIGPASSIFTEGGFRRNDAYLSLLAALFPGNETYTTELQEASCFGAALCARAMLDGRSIVDYRDLVSFERTSVLPARLPALGSYVDEWVGALGAGQVAG